MNGCDFLLFFDNILHLESIRAQPCFYISKCSYFLAFPNYEIAATYIRENDKENFRENDFSNEVKSFDDPMLVLSDSIGHLERQTTNRKHRKLDENPNKADDYVSGGSQNG
uniref:Uncharacterized protein n=1 Tax=Clytia hemisphaerica TaxID=252671 RepID=A0A7M6DNT7_9CNID